MKFGKIYAAAAACAMLCNFFCGTPAVKADSAIPDVYEIASFADEESMKAALTDYAPCGIVEQNARMFENTLRLSADADEGLSYMCSRNFNMDFSAPEYSEYKYLNLWVYAPDTLPTDSDGKPSTLDILLRTTAKSNKDAFYYSVPVDKAGWNMISVALADFKNRDSGSWETTPEVKEFWIMTNTKLTNMPDVVKWPADGSGYVLMDSIYLSKSKPEKKLGIGSASIADGAKDVPPTLDGGNTVSFTMDNELRKNTLHASRVTVTENGDAMEDAYSVSANENRLNITFSAELKTRGEYEICLSPGSVYDVYGNTFDKEYKIHFTVSGIPSEFKIISTEPADGATGVAADTDSVKLLFNSAPKNAGQYITVYENGVKMEKSRYSVSSADETVTIYFEDGLENDAAYSVVAAAGMGDTYGNTLKESRTFSFTTERKAPDIAEIISMDGEDKINGITGSNIAMTEENARMFDKTLRVDISAGKDQTIRGTCAPIDADLYDYVNYWIYSPTATPYGINLVFMIDGQNYFIYPLPVDWSGWRLVSVPLASFKIKNAPDWASVAQWRINANAWTGYTKQWEEDGYILLDKIFLSRELPASLEYLGSSLPRNYAGAPIMDMGVDFTFSNELSQVMPGAVKIKENGEASDIAFAAAADGNTLKLRFSDTLACGAEYTVVIGDEIYNTAGMKPDGAAEYVFTAEAGTLSVGKPVFDGLAGAGESIDISARVINNSDSEQSVTLTAAQYDADGGMTDVVNVTDSFTAGAQFDLRAQLTCRADTAVIRAFVRGADGRLLRGDYSALGNERKTSGRVFAGSAEDNLEITAAKVTVDELEIAGVYGGAGAVLLALDDPDGEEALITPVCADADGNFSYMYKFGENAVSGVYNAVVSAGSKSRKAEVTYIARQLRQELLSIVNSAKTAAQVTPILEKYGAALGIGDAAKYEFIAETLIEQAPYSSYADFTAMALRACDTLDKLNATAWSGMSAFLKANAELVMHGAAEYDYYSKLSEKNQNIINRELEKKLPVSSFAAFRSIFSATVKGINTPSDTGSSGSSGGGGGGGSSVNIAPVIAAPSAESAAFADLDGSEWAKDSIESLYKKGIVAQSEDKKFRPDDNITREEFVKLLAAALGLSPSGEKSGFSDTADGAWYEPYLSAARAAGIISGNDDGSFGVGSCITRQDMSAMAYRAVCAAGKTLAKTAAAAEFSDAASVSEYAREAVSAMQTGGIISGMGDNTFAPLEYSTRAQAAVIIARLLRAMEN